MFSHITNDDLKIFYYFDFATAYENARFWISYTLYTENYTEVPAIKDEHENKKNTEDKINTNEKNSEDKNNKKTRWEKWTRIAPNLYLSIIPSISKEADQVDLIKTYIASFGEKPGLIVSVVNKNEIGQTNIASPQTIHEKKIRQHILPMADFTAESPNNCIMEAIYEIEKTIQNGEAVILHCKAGRGRSAMLAVICEALRSGKTVEEIEALIKGEALEEDDQNKQEKKRPQVGLHEEQREKAKNIIAEIKKLIERGEFTERPYENFKRTENLEADLENFLVSFELKNEMRKWWAFNELQTRACLIQYTWFGWHEISEEIQDLFKKIYDAKNGSWYAKLLTKTSVASSCSDLNCSDFISAELSQFTQIEDTTLSKKSDSNSYFQMFKEVVVKKIGSTAKEFSNYVPYVPTLFKKQSNPESELTSLYTKFVEQIDAYILKRLNCSAEELKQAKIQLCSRVNIEDECDTKLKNFY